MWSDLTVFAQRDILHSSSSSRKFVGLHYVFNNTWKWMGIRVFDKTTDREDSDAEPRLFTIY